MFYNIEQLYHLHPIFTRFQSKKYNLTVYSINPFAELSKQILDTAKRAQIKMSLFQHFNLYLSHIICNHSASTKPANPLFMRVCGLFRSLKLYCSRRFTSQIIKHPIYMIYFINNSRSNLLK